MQQCTYRRRTLDRCLSETKSGERCAAHAGRAGHDECKCGKVKRASQAACAKCNKRDRNFAQHQKERRERLLAKAAPEVVKIVTDALPVA